MTSLQSNLFMHRRKLAISSIFCGVYAGTCYNALSWKNDVLRMGVAGSIATLICDSSFHVIDTVNIRAKAAIGQSQ